MLPQLSDAVHLLKKLQGDSPVMLASLMGWETGEREPLDPNATNIYRAEEI